MTANQALAIATGVFALLLLEVVRGWTLFKLFGLRDELTALSKEMRVQIVKLNSTQVALEGMKRAVPPGVNEDISIPSFLLKEALPDFPNIVRPAPHPWLKPSGTKS